jgi:ribosomal protein S18 acetylase RimI-like enzyme
MYGFVAGQPLLPRGSRDQRKGNVCSGRPQLSMLAEATKKKRAAPLVFSTDMKGKYVWTLRSATEADAKPACDLEGQTAIYTEGLVASIFGSDHRCSVVCEASVKGTKEGEGFKGVVLGSVLADIVLSLRDRSGPLDGPLDKHAEIFAVDVSSELPDPADTKRKMVLGCMSKLKKAGVLDVERSVAVDDKEEVQFYEGIGFQGAAKGAAKGAVVTFTADLTGLNPDPMKKMV